MNAKATFKGRNATCQTILFGNVQGLAHFVIGKSKRLDFGMPPLAVKRNDDLDVQERILAMTPQERKALGISKSGLWYQKRLAESKTIKVYDKVLSKLILY